MNEGRSCTPTLPDWACAYDREGTDLIKHAQISLKATVVALEKTGTAIDSMPKGLRSGLGAALLGQMAALKNAMATMVAASTFSDGQDHSEMEDIIARAEDMVDKLETKKAAS